MPADKLDTSLAGGVALALRMGRLDLDMVVRAAAVRWWAWDAVEQVAPDRLTFPRPKRRRGQDAEANLVRDSMIALECDHVRAIEPTVDRAYELVAASWGMTEKNVERIYLARRQQRNRR